MNDLKRRPATTTRNAVPRGEVSGVLETLAAGFSMVLERPYLFLLPLVVDLWTWLGIQVRGDALVTAMQDALLRQDTDNTVALAADLNGVADRLRVNDAVASLTPSIFSGLPSDTLLNMLIGALAPAMATGVDRTTMYDSWSNGLAATVQPASWAGVIGVAAAFFAAATLLMTLFKVPLAHAVRGDGWNGRGLARDIFLGWLRFLGLVGLVVVAFAVVGLPLMLGTAAVLLAGVNLLPLVSLAVFILGTMAALYAYFVLDAMFIYRVGPIQAARMSYAVARINLGQTWRFAGASLLIASGLLQIWHVIVENPPGVIIALVTNAVVGTGLSVASMMFFHDRARLPRSVPAMNTFSTRRGFPPRSS